MKDCQGLKYCIGEKFDCEQSAVKSIIASNNDAVTLALVKLSMRCSLVINCHNSNVEYVGNRASCVYYMNNRIENENDGLGWDECSYGVI